MIDNPLIEAGRKPRAGRVTEDMLHAHAADLNRKHFVITAGKPYFVSRRNEPGGNVVHYLDRTP